MGKIIIFFLLIIVLLQIVASSHERRHSRHGVSKLYFTKLLKKETSIDNNNSHFSSSIDDLELNKFVVSQEGLKNKDEIKKLPGQPIVKFKQYGGYVRVNESAGRALFYYFVEAHENSKSLPLLLWLNGGPGCSSIGYGAMEEIGPFRVHSDGKTLYRNDYSWNNAANILFLESPAGVGFSYSNTSSDLKSNGDRSTSIDNIIFLLNWLQRFPEYKNRDFYIAGESYAGHFVPQLAEIILHHNKLAKKTLINLKGIMIGNAVINYETDKIGMYEYHASHGLIPDEISEQIERHCNFTDKALSQSHECDNAIDIAIADTDPIDLYNIYTPLCPNYNDDLSTSAYTRNKYSQVIDPCSDDYVISYMNRLDVQKALHANVTKIKYNWQPCSEVIEGWMDSPLTIISVLKEVMANGIQVWIFSGDTDGIVPITSTKKSIKKMKLPIETPWYPWFHNDEVGGYTQIYKGNLTFATVRGAGHQVPSYEPARALSLAKHFLKGTHLPNSPTHIIIT